MNERKASIVEPVCTQVLGRAGLRCFLPPPPVSGRTTGPPLHLCRPACPVTHAASLRHAAAPAACTANAAAELALRQLQRSPPGTASSAQRQPLCAHGSSVKQRSHCCSYLAAPGRSLGPARRGACRGSRCRGARESAASRVAGLRRCSKRRTLGGSVRATHPEAVSALCGHHQAAALHAEPERHSLEKRRALLRAFWFQLAERRGARGTARGRGGRAL